MDILNWGDIIGFVAILTFLWGIWNKISKVEKGLAQNEKKIEKGLAQNEKKMVQNEKNMVQMELRLTKEIRAVSERVATLEERTRRPTDIIPEA